MKRFLSIILRYVALVALYMLITWGLSEIFGTFHFWRVLILGWVFSGIMLGFSEWQSRKRQR